MRDNWVLTHQPTDMVSMKNKVNKVGMDTLGSSADIVPDKIQDGLLGSHICSDIICLWQKKNIAPSQMQHWISCTLNICRSQVYIT